MPSGRVVDFNDVFRAEIAVINERRACQKPPRVAVVLEPEADDHVGEPVLGPNDEAKLVGLALSGGGVRSSALCLGALQALNEAGVLAQVDYLSTVSGGGYIGCSLSAGLESTRGKFPFESRVVEDETPSLQHLRDHSNYLFPAGAIDLVRNASIYARGLVANFVLIMPFLLVVAAFTIVLHPTPGDLDSPFLDRFGLNISGFQYFALTACLSLALVGGIVVWSLLRSSPALQNRPEVPSGLTTFIGWAVLILLLSAFCELQPFVLAGMFEKNGGFFFAIEVGQQDLCGARAARRRARVSRRQARRVRQERDGIDAYPGEDCGLCREGGDLPRRRRRSAGAVGDLSQHHVLGALHEYRVARLRSRVARRAAA